MFAGGGAGLPSANMTAHFDFSDISTLYKTRTAGNNPGYSDVATTDADVIRAIRSIYPAATSDLVLSDANNSALAPALRLTSPLLGTQCLDFDGSNDRMVVYDRTITTARVASVIFGVGAKTALISFRCESLPASPSTYQPLMADLSGSFFWGIYIYNNAGTVQLLFQNYDGTYDSLFHGTVAADTNYVAVVRHDGTNIYAALNNASESSLASGNSSDLGSAFYIGGGSDSSVFNGRIGEVVTYNAALTGGNLTDAITYMTDKWT